MYRRRVDDRTLTFGVSGMLLHNAFLMFDRETRTLWSHFTGEAVAGPLRGKRLESVASVPQISWRAVRQRYPSARVLSVGGRQDVPHDEYAEYHADSTRLGVRPLARRDTRLPGKAMVIGVVVNGGARAYPWAALGREVLVNDVLANVPLLVARSDSLNASFVYRRAVGGRTLEFEGLGPGLARDRQTGTRWDLLRGVGEEGPLQGQQLEMLPFVNVYWFAWAAYYPRTEIYVATNRDEASR